MKKALVLLPLLGLLAFIAVATQAPAKGQFERVLRAAPADTYETLSGEPVNFYTSNTRPIAVNLFASWCGPCESEHDLLTELSQMAPGQVHGVLYKDKMINGQEFLRRLGNPYRTIIHDPEGRLGLDFGLTGVPETFIVSTDGNILHHVRGPLTPKDVETVASLLRTERPE